MIPVSHPLPEPGEFDEKCRKKGGDWLAKNPNCERPSDFWSPFRHSLADGFSNRCGFGAMWIASGTVDHFASVNENKALAYEWKNYRYIEGWINSSKSKRNHAEILDPFEVKDGWFEISLPSLQLSLTDAVPDAFRQRAENTLKWLHLRDDERIMRTRREWYRMYQDKELLLDGLRKKAPLIAAAVEKKAAEQAVG
jgi:hypothetical protein